MASSSGLSDFKKREEEKKARQAGELAPEIDAASGKMINPHNPEYITKRPWYLGESGPSLNHHAKQGAGGEESLLSLQEMEELLARQARVQQQKKAQGRDRATVFRKGACENCGAMTHKKKECVERPRSLGKTAKISGQDIAPDEGVRGVEGGEGRKLGWDGKRDQWAGYRAEDHERVIERYEQMEEERKRQALERKEEMKKEKERRRREKEQARQKKTKEKTAARKAAAAAAAPGGGGKEQGKEGGSAAAANGTGTKTTTKKKKEGGKEEAEEESGSEGSASDSDASDASDSDSDSDSDYDSDEEDEDEEGVGEFLLKDKDNKDFQGRVARQGGVGGAQMKVSVRNLRIREDTAKYLRNLDPNSAYYDPKTRAMRENPLPGSRPEEVVYAGDNWLRATGDTVALARMQVFALEAQEQGIDVHAEANPTAAILAKKKFESSQGVEKEEARKKVLEAYGAEKYSKKPDARLLLGQTETWTEYSKDGRVVKGAPRAVVRSKYEEDIQINNHTTVWGSFYEKRSGKWGFGCCHSVIRQSYCTGVEGRKANEEYSEALLSAGGGGGTRKREGEEEEGEEEGGKEKKKKSKLMGEMTTRSELYGSDAGAAALELDAKKLKEAVKRQKAFQKERVEADDRNRGYNVKGGGGGGEGGEVTKEDMEAYRLVRSHGEDPMAKIGSDELLE